MKKPSQKRRTRLRHLRREQTDIPPDIVPAYTSSIDASVPDENIIAVYFEEIYRRWIAVNRSRDGSLQIGHGNTEALARRVAGLKAIHRLKGKSNLVPASDRFVSINHNSPDFVRLTSKLDELIEAIRKNNEYAARDPEDRSRRISELESGKELLKRPGAASIAVLASVLTYLGLKFSDTLIGKLADTTFSLLEKFLGG